MTFMIYNNIHWFIMNSLGYCKWKIFHAAIMEVCYHYAIMDQQAKTVNSTSPHHFSGSKQLQSYEKKDKGCNFSPLRLYLLALLK